jgi:hypothetical protein
MLGASGAKSAGPGFPGLRYRSGPGAAPGPLRAPPIPCAAFGHTASQRDAGHPPLRVLAAGRLGNKTRNSAYMASPKHVPTLRAVSTKG